MEALRHRDEVVAIVLLLMGELSEVVAVPDMEVRISLRELSKVDLLDLGF